LKFEGKLNDLNTELRELKLKHHNTCKALREREELKEGFRMALEQKTAENTELQQGMVDMWTRTRS